MEQQETTTTQQKTSPSTENHPEDVKPVKDKSPTNPANWWGGWISQAKEKVSFKLLQNDSHSDSKSNSSSNIIPVSLVRLHSQHQSSKQ